MAWHDTLSNLRKELAQARAERSRQWAEQEAEQRRQRQRLSELAASLEIPSLLAEMNRVLLEGQGEVQTFSSWEPGEDDLQGENDALFTDEEDDQEESDVITSILDWEEDGEQEIAVDLGLIESGFYLQVNGVDTRVERGALERALVQAFRDELEL